jgi:predicted nucleotidyltransferase component of viral defense system
MNIALHRRVLLTLLKEIYTHAALAPVLGFKGGTCLYFLDDLPRFSVDLDFNVMEGTDAFDPAAMEKILRRELTINDSAEKEHTWLWNGVYEAGQWNLKVEVSKRIFDDEYEQRRLYGLPLCALKREYQLSHKLCAITDRSTLQNRDIFDAHFLLSNHVSIVDAIIRKRTKKSTKEYLKELLIFLPAHISRRGILDGLGEFVDPEKKQWVQSHLLQETLFLLRSRSDEYAS